MLKELLTREPPPARKMRRQFVYPASTAATSSYLIASSSNAEVKVLDVPVKIIDRPMINSCVGWTTEIDLVTVGATSTAETAPYDPNFVAEIRRADAQPPEREFGNVVDMLEWLNRD